ncbi:MAG: ATP-binding cassette domain-containing protein [bacterium]|nr:ATP-binding cassette domain-containing protein [bacterium]
MFTLEGVSKRFGETQALKPMDLDVPDGQTTVLIGQSGCGKSTLIRLMVGLIRPDTGTVFFEDQELGPENVLALRQKMGYVIQEGGLFPHLTARDNVGLMATYLGWEGDRIEGRIAELAELTHFPEDGMDRFPGELSGGQRQRVSLMRALMLDPDVLLLDEPLGALDPMIRADLQTELKDIFQDLRKTVVMVTHDMSEAGFFGDRIVLLREGHIVQEGSLEDLVKRPVETFVTAFINAQRSRLEGIG